MIEGKLPLGFNEYEVVGINISPMVINKEMNKGITLENYKNLINYIIEI